MTRRIPTAHHLHPSCLARFERDVLLGPSPMDLAHLHHLHLCIYIHIFRYMDI